MGTDEDSNDYVIIPNGQAAQAAATAAAAVIVQGVDKYCGRYFGTDAFVADGTVCSQFVPFKLSVFTDDLEVSAAAAANAVGKANINEASAGVADTPTGTMGFSLGF